MTDQDHSDPYYQLGVLKGLIELAIKEARAINAEHMSEDSNLFIIKLALGTIDHIEETFQGLPKTDYGYYKRDEL